MKNRNGAAPVVFLVAIGLIVGITGRGLHETHKSEKLKENGKVIMCKVKGNPASQCDALRSH